MMHIATILPGQWKQHMIHRYAVWVNRLGRAVSAELKKLPERPPPLPWPVRANGRDTVRQTNSGLFPKFPAKPQRRAHAMVKLPRLKIPDRGLQPPQLPVPHLRRHPGKSHTHSLAHDGILVREIGLCYLCDSVA